jgi:hypothetical protein
MTTAITLQRHIIGLSFTVIHMVASFSALGLTALANAAELTLKCRTAEGDVASDLTVDLENKTMRWGGLPYIITSVTGDFLTAMQFDDVNVGGEIFVLDRATGHYERSSVGLMCNDGTCLSSTRSTLRASTYQGNCKKSVR